MTDRQTTHAHGCWSWGPRHYKCAVGQIERDEAQLRQVIKILNSAHQTAMEQTLKARIPECGEFAGIAQDLDFVVAALRERLRREAEAEARLTVAQQPAEQHPDDAAVDRFAAAMKAKLKKKRQEGRAGWQFMASEQLSALLHEHVRKGDPVDVANLAMMLHQNGQVIEPPAAVVSDEMVEILQAEVERLEKAMHALEQHDEALLRQALKALESGAWDTLRGRNAAAAIRERLGEKVRSSKQ